MDDQDGQDDHARMMPACCPPACPLDTQYLPTYIPTPIYPPYMGPRRIGGGIGRGIGALLCQHTPIPVPPHIRPRRAPCIGPPAYMRVSVRESLP